MNKRTCENCRWFDENPILDNDGFCRRNPPTGDGADLPRVEPKDFCGEWADKTITPEQEERQELTRQFALTLMSTEWGKNLDTGVWKAAEKLAVAEPQIQKENGK
jgi:hypothetical protein